MGATTWRPPAALIAIHRFEDAGFEAADVEVVIRA